MPCVKPLCGIKRSVKNPSGKYSFKVLPHLARNNLVKDTFIDLPCGQCIWCRLDRSRQWAVRCFHENQFHEQSCFITLTYREEDYPNLGSLCLQDFQKFMYRVRKKYGQGIKVFYCGEYGEKFARPHFHAILYGIDFTDRKRFKGKDQFQIDSSEQLDNLWKLGFTSVGNVTFESAGYVARYVTKKVNGEKSEDHYSVKDGAGDLIGFRKPEFCNSSKREALGLVWLKEYFEEVYHNDFIVINGVKSRPPKYYDRKFEEWFPNEMKWIKAQRETDAVDRDYSLDRLHAKEVILNQKFEKLIRSYESEIEL